MFRLASTSKRPVLLLEGIGSDLEQCQMRREAIQGALVTAAVQTGVPILRSVDKHESAQLLAYAVGRFRPRERWRGGALRPIGSRRPQAKERVQMHVLQGIPGVGPGHAQRLIHRFGSIEAVAAADIDELSQTDGIGDNTARRIRWAVGEVVVPYG